MSAADVARALRGRRKRGGGFMVRCPAHDDRTPSLSVDDGDDGRILVKCFAGCDGRDVLAALKKLDLLPERDGKPRSLSPKSALARAPIEPHRGALEIWRESEPAEGTAVERYLRRRGITIPIPPTIKYHSALRYARAGLLFPAMVGAVQNADGQIVGVHRTFILVDGRKAQLSSPKMMLGPCGGGAVRLGAATEKIVVAEGIETSLSVAQAIGTAVWAALSTSGLRALELPDGVREVVIAADGDAAGEQAARAAAARWITEGRRVRIANPPASMDFNDVLVAASEANHG